MNDQIMSLVRSILKIGGTFLVTKGFLDAGSLDIVVGALVAISGVVWSMFAHKKA